jgi:hypothetical protein
MKKLIYILLLSVICVSGRSQISHTHKAYRAIQEDKLELAIAYIDSAMVDATEAKDPQTWHIAGYIYKEVFKQREMKDYDSPAREKALEVYAKSLALDAAGEYTKNTIIGIVYLAKSFYNQCVITLVPTSYQTSIVSYERYKSIYLSVEPDKDFKQQDVQYFNALGSMLSEHYERNKSKNAEFADLSIKYLHKTLEIEPDNLTSNMIIGVLLYNKGVDLILELDPNASLEVLIETQDKCVELFLKAKPYLLKAHAKDPTNCEIIKGLKGIEFNLNDKEKVKNYDSLLKQLGCPEDE